MIENILMGVIGTSIIGAICIILFCFLSWICQKRYVARARKNVWIIIAIYLLLPLNGLELPYLHTVKIPNVVIKEYDNLPVMQQSISYDDSQKEIIEPVQMEEQKGENTTIEITTQEVLFVVWIFVVAVLAIYYLIGYLKTCHKAKRWSHKCQDEEIETIVKEIASELSIKHIPNIRIMKDSVRGPFTTGIMRKVVFLPDENWLEKDVYYILKHELVHCKERDILWKLLFLVVNVVHWFNPFVWFMRKFAENDIEQACDEVVLKGAASEERREYSEIIMLWVEKSRQKGSPLSTSYMSGIAFLKWRFSNIYDNTSKKKGFILIGEMCVIILLFSSIVNITWGDKTQHMNATVITEEQEAYQVSNIPIDFGIEVRTNLDGDEREDRVRVVDMVSGDVAYTQIVAIANGEVQAIKNFDGYYSSQIVTGDLSGNGRADVLLVRYVFGSNYGAIQPSILHLEGEEWIEYPYNFIQNPNISLEQPKTFGDPEDTNLDRYIGAVIFEKDGKTMVRFIGLMSDISDETVKIVEASYREDGWYIENVEIVHEYWSKNKYEEYAELEY